MSQKSATADQDTCRKNYKNSILTPVHNDKFKDKLSYFDKSKFKTMK